MNFFRHAADTVTQRFAKGRDTERHRRSNERQDKTRPSKLRRGCGRLARAIVRCVVPCCDFGGRRRGDAAGERVPSVSHPHMPREERRAACTVDENGEHENGKREGQQITVTAFQDGSRTDGNGHHGWCSGDENTISTLLSQDPPAVIITGILKITTTSHGLMETVVDFGTAAVSSVDINGQREYSVRDERIIAAVVQNSSDATDGYVHHGWCSGDGCTTRSLQSQDPPAVITTEILKITTTTHGLIMYTTPAVLRTAAACNEAIVARAVVRQRSFEKELLTRPTMAPWSRWTSVLAPETIDRVHARLAAAARVYNEWFDPTVPRIRTRLADVPFRFEPTWPVVRGHFGNWSLRAAVSEGSDRIQNQRQQDNAPAFQHADRLVIPEEAFREFNTVGRLITACMSMGWDMPFYTYDSTAMPTATSTLHEHTVRCHVVFLHGRMVISAGVASTKRAAKRLAALKVLKWLAVNASQRIPT